MDKGKYLSQEGQEEEGAEASNNSVVNPSSLVPVTPATLVTSDLAQYDETTSTDVMQFWHDISIMLQSPERSAAPHKADSEALEAVVDPSFVGSNGKKSEDFLSMLFDMDKPLSECAPSSKVMMGSETSVLMSPQSPIMGENLTSNPNEELSVGKLGNQSLDGSSSSKSGPLDLSSRFLSSVMAGKHYSIAELAQMVLLDPKRAKRVMTNRTSAMRSKERKMRYTSELEQKAQILQIETSRLSSQLDIAKKHNSALTLENKELMMCLLASEECAKLQKELTNALRAEMQRLQETNDQAIVDDGNSSQELPSSSNQHRAFLLVCLFLLQRMFSNRQSAARSREKMRCVGELKKKVERKKILLWLVKIMKIHQQKLERRLSCSVHWIKLCKRSCSN